MHKQIAFSFLIIGLLIGSFASAQVKIGENPQTIDPASVLELESTDRVLVITRVDSLQMAAIAPIRGALVYNTSADCVFYYDGTDWINLCGDDAAIAGFTTNPIVNDSATIVITPTPTGGNIEIARNSINSSMVVDGGISGIKIQNGSIGRGKLQNNSVDRTKLAENSVGPFAIDNDSVDLADFNNITGFIRSADIVSGNAGNAIVAGGDGGAFYDDAAVAANTAAIAAAVAADDDKNPSNEIQTLDYDAASRTITLSLSGGSVTLPVGAVEVDGDVSNELITASVLNGNILTITEGGNPFDIDLTGLGGGGGGDDNQTAAEVPVTAIPTNYIATTQDVEAHLIGIDAALASGGGGGTTEFVDGTTLAGLGTIADPFTIIPGTDGQFLSTNVDGDVVWSVPPGGGGGGGQDLAAVLAEGSDANANPIKNLLNPVDPQDAATRSYVDGAIISGGAPLIDGNILIGDATNAPTPQNISGDATLDNAGVLTITDDAITTAKILNGQVQTDDIADTNVTDAKIAPGGADQILRTTADGSAVTWVDLPGGTVSVDGTTITGDGIITALSVPTDGITTDQITDGSILAGDIADNAIETIKILDANVTDAKIAPGAADQILRTTADGSAVTWVDLPGGIVTVDGTTITGDGDITALSVTTDGITTDQIADGTVATLDIADNAIETAKILDANVTDAKIAPGAADQILRTTADGSAVTWVDLPGGTGGIVTVDGSTIAGDGDATALSVPTDGITTDQIADGTIVTGDIADNAIETAKILDANVTDTKIAPGAADQILRTTADGSAVTWVDLPGGTGGIVTVDGSTIAGDGDATALSVPTDGITTNQIADGTVATTDIADNAIETAKILDANVTDAKIAPGAADQILRTTADGSAVTWVDLPEGTSAVTVDGTTITGDGDITALSVPTDGIATEQITDGTIGTIDIADNAIETAKILDANVTDAKIAPGAADQILRTSADGSVVTWVDLPVPNPGLTSVSVNGSTFSGDGTSGNQLELIANSISSIEIEDNAVETNNILNDAVTIDKIDAGTDGQVLTTSGTDVIWEAPTTGPVSTDASINGNGSTVPLSVANDAIGTGELQVNAVTTVSILNANVIPAKLAPSLTDGEVLTTVLGNVEWAGAPNLSGQNLQQTASVNRTYDINNGNLSFIGTGFVGIGNLANPPTNKLHVAGAIRSQGILNSEGTTPNEPSYRFNDDTDTGMYRGTLANYLRFATAGSEAMTISPSQNVGIGPLFNAINSNPILARLHVDGDIRAEGSFISADTAINLPDYVFQKYFLGSSSLKENYNFKSLKEIETFIKKHHHLPGIKSAAEVKKEGSWNLSESNLQNLEKIEELYLHTIEQEKKINLLQSEKETLSDEVKTLRNDLDEIKAMLKKSE